MHKKFGIPVKYKNKLEMIKKLIEVHLIMFPPNENLPTLHERAKEALAYYIVYGYNKETVEDVETSLSQPIKNGYVRSINSVLRKYGFLIKDRNNKNKNYLSPDMQKYQEEFVDRNGKLLTIGFVKQ